MRITAMPLIIIGFLAGIFMLTWGYSGSGNISYSGIESLPIYAGILLMLTSLLSAVIILFRR